MMAEAEGKRRGESEEDGRPYAAMAGDRASRCFAFGIVKYLIIRRKYWRKSKRPSPLPNFPSPLGRGARGEGINCARTEEVLAKIGEKAAGHIPAAFLLSAFRMSLASRAQKTAKLSLILRNSSANASHLSAGAIKIRR